MGNGQGVGVVIHDFSFTAVAAPAFPALGRRGAFALAACLLGAGAV
jgi:hypothetical protein